MELLLLGVLCVLLLPGILMGLLVCLFGRLLIWCFEGLLSPAQAGDAGGPRAPLIRKSQSEAVLTMLHDLHPLSRHCFPCLVDISERALKEVVEACGEDEAQDWIHKHDDFSLFRGSYEAPPDSLTVELESTRTVQAQRDAVKRLRELCHPLVPLGCALYALLLGGGFVSGLLCRCGDGPGAWGFAFPVAAVLLQVYWLNRVTILLSQTEVEGRPLLRLLKTLRGLENYHVMACLSVVDAVGRFTRAQFVGYLQHCSSTVEVPFQQLFSGPGAITGAINRMGIHGAAMLTFIVGPVAIQFGYMLWLRRKVGQELEEAEAHVGHTGERGEAVCMEVTDSVDDLGALMEWAMLNPAGKVMDLAAVPLNLDHEDDVKRLWDRMLTHTLVVVARNVPDGVFQMTLQAWFLCLVFPGISLLGKAQLVTCILLSSLSVVADSVDLILLNRRITVLAGAGMLLLMLPGFLRTAGSFLCESSVVGIILSGQWCLPPGAVEHGSWLHDTLPG